MQTPGKGLIDGIEEEDGKIHYQEEDRHITKVELFFQDIHHFNSF